MKQGDKVIHPKSSGVAESELTPASERMLFTETLGYLSGEATPPGPLDAVTRQPISGSSVSFSCSQHAQESQAGLPKLLTKTRAALQKDLPGWDALDGRWLCSGRS